MARKTRKEREAIVAKRLEGKRTNCFITVAGQRVRLIDATELKK